MAADSKLVHGIGSHLSAVEKPFKQKLHGQDPSRADIPQKSCNSDSLGGCDVSKIRNARVVSAKTIPSSITVK